MTKAPDNQRHTFRLQGYDYSKEGAYFITICTYERRHLFGNVAENTFNCSSVGSIAREMWFKIPEHFGNVNLDEFIVMPNHVHGIVFIHSNVGVKFNAPTNYGSHYSNISPRQGTLSVMIRTYKSAVTHTCKVNGYDLFRWQRNYYEHVIRNEDDLREIRDYVIYNPLKWEFDSENIK